MKASCSLNWGIYLISVGLQREQDAKLLRSELTPNMFKSGPNSVCLQTHRMAVVDRDIWAHLVQLLLKQGPPEQVLSNLAWLSSFSALVKVLPWQPLCLLVVSWDEEHGPAWIVGQHGPALELHCTERGMEPWESSLIASLGKNERFIHESMYGEGNTNKIQWYSHLSVSGNFCIPGPVFMIVNHQIRLKKKKKKQWQNPRSFTFLCLLWSDQFMTKDCCLPEPCTSLHQLFPHRHTLGYSSAEQFGCGNS